MPSIGSLCTGYGGLDLAVEKLTGGKTVWVSDIDKNANVILAQRFPHAPNLGDLKTVNWSAVEPVDILTAGYPCQPFSNAGLRKGTDDPRHIFPYIAEAVRVLRPGVVVLENVRGHLTRGFGDVHGTLADLGYDTRWGCVRASDAGAPHRRERVFIVAEDSHGTARDEWRKPAPGQAESWGPWPDAGGRGGVPAPAYAGGERHGGREVRPGVPRLDGQDEGAAFERERSREIPGDRGAAFGPYSPAIARWESLTRPAPDSTEPSGRGGAHRLSPKFVEWMMGLPDGWVTDTGLTRSAQLKALGNGVVPQQAELALTLLGMSHDT